MRPLPVARLACALAVLALSLPAAPASPRSEEPAPAAVADQRPEPGRETSSTNRAGTSSSAR